MAKMTLSGLNQRLVAYVTAAVLTQTLGEGDNLRHASTWIDYLMILTRVTLAGVIIWRAFIDQSKSELDAVAAEAAKRVGLVLVATLALLYLTSCAGAGVRSTEDPTVIETWQRWDTSKLFSSNGPAYEPAPMPVYVK